METEYYLWIGLEQHEKDVRTHETHKITQAYSSRDDGMYRMSAVL